MKNKKLLYTLLSFLIYIMLVTVTLSVFNMNNTVLFSIMTVCYYLLSESIINKIIFNKFSLNTKK